MSKIKYQIGGNTSNFQKEEYVKVKGGKDMNSYNYGGCGCNSFMNSFPCNPFGCGGCGFQSFPCNCGCGFNGGFGNSGCTWFAIVLVVFLLLIICGCTKIC